MTGCFVKLNFVGFAPRPAVASQAGPQGDRDDGAVAACRARRASLTTSLSGAKPADRRAGASEDGKQARRRRGGRGRLKLRPGHARACAAAP